MQKRLVDEKPIKIWLACSGGLDSMVLTHTLAAIRPPEVELEALHVNFRLRAEESDKDADFVRSSCRALGLRCQTLSVDTKSHPPGLRGIQEWAREIRYQWFRSLMQEGQWLALAHHADDLVETILMRIARGAHISQLKAMEEFREGLWRPFLGLGRAALEQEAKKQNIAHREDSSNAKLVYSRNVIRHRILPELEALYPGVRQNLSHLAQDALDFSQFSEDTEGGLDASELAKLPGAVARQRLGRFLRPWLGSKEASREILETLRLALVEGRDLTLELNPRFRALIRVGSLSVEPAQRRRTTRWEQYRRGIVDSRPCLWLTASATFQPTMRLEGDERIVDND